MKKLKKYVKQIKANPHVFCFNDCCITDCAKHKNRCPYDGEYLFAYLKDTPYCLYEKLETYEKDGRVD
jgi:hypothetical protein